MEDQLYKEIILEHWQNPLNYGLVKNPDFKLSGNNPTCGDQITITGKINNGIITEIKFKSSGCAISKASASLFLEQIKNEKIIKILKLTEKDILNNLGVEITPARFNCALLAFNTLKKHLIR